MRQRRPLYDHRLWRCHRSSLCHLRHLLSSPSSRVILSLVPPPSPPVTAFTTFAADLAAYNSAFELGWLRLLPGCPSLPFLYPWSLPYELSAPALALLLVFLTKASYSRFEEGRKAWPAREAMAVAADGDDDGLVQRGLLNYIIAFPVTLKCHVIYRSDLKQDLKNLLDEQDLAVVLGSKHRLRCVIEFILQSMNLLHMQYSKRHILEEKLSSFHEGIGACEQLMGIPIPLLYTRLTSRFVVLWHLTLPVILWDDCNFIVILATFFNTALKKWGFSLRTISNAGSCRTMQSRQ